MKYKLLISALAVLLLLELAHSFKLKRMHEKKSALTNKIKIRYGTGNYRKPDVTDVRMILIQLKIHKREISHSLEKFQGNFQKQCKDF